MPTLKRRGKVWYAYWWEGKGKDRVKRWKALSLIKGEADRKLDEINNLLEARRYNHRPTKLTWETFWKEYLERTKGTKSVAAQERDGRILKLFNGIMPVRFIIEVTAKTLETYIRERKTAGWKDSTINRELSTLKNMTKKAREWGYLIADPWADVHKFHIEEGARKYFTAEDNQEIYEFCADAYERTIHALGTLQGLRPGEMAELKWSDIDLKEGLVNVASTAGRRTNPKKRMRTLPLHAQTKKNIKELRADTHGEYLLGLHDRQMGARYIARVYKRVLERSGKQGSIYWTRHTFGTDLAAGKVNIRMIQDLLGHSRITTTQIYVHPLDKHKKSAVRGLLGNT